MPTHYPLVPCPIIIEKLENAIANGMGNCWSWVALEAVVDLLRWIVGFAGQVKLFQPQ